MKKIFSLLVLVLGTVFWASAFVQDSSMLQYTGRYKFSETADLPIAEVTVNEHGLQLSSSMGVATLQHIEGDRFCIVELHGTAEFVRSSDKKINKVIIRMMAFELEGAKEHKRSLLFHPLSPQKFLSYFEEG